MTWRIYGYYQPQENKWYVGRTCRKYQSMRTGKNGSQYVQQCPKFADAILKYGWSSFEYHVFETTEDEDTSCELEKKWIALKNSIVNGYNIQKGGKGQNGVSLSEETKKKISESEKGKKMSKSALEKAKATRKKNGTYGKRTKGSSRPVRQFTRYGKLVAEYPSAMEAYRQTGIQYQEINHCCRHWRNWIYAGGYMWEYA